MKGAVTVMKGHTLLKAILKKWQSHAQKPLKENLSKSTTQQLQALKVQSNLLQALLLLLENNFSKEVREQTILALDKLSESSETARNHFAIFLLLEQLVSDRKYVKEKNSKKMIGAKEENISSEAQMLCNRSLREVVKQSKQLESWKIEKSILKDFNLNVRFEISFLMKLLDERREKLFNQIVEIIRTSQPTDDRLRSQAGNFVALLSLSVEAGFEKGKKLLQTIEALAERLTHIHDGEKFREFLEEMEKQRLGDLKRVSEVEKLRLARKRLGVLQAHALQAFHAHLPVTLQVLKRRIPAVL